MLRGALLQLKIQAITVAEDELLIARMTRAELNVFVSDFAAGAASAGRELRPLVEGVRGVVDCLCADAKRI